MPFGPGKCVILWYIEVALGFTGVNVKGFVSSVSKRIEGLVQIVQRGLLLWGLGSYCGQGGRQ